MTKGQLIKALHAKGIRYGERNGVMLKLGHLKWYELVKLYSDNV